MCTGLAIRGTRVRITIDVLGLASIGRGKEAGELTHGIG
jgi:hypothetical protein